MIEFYRPPDCVECDGIEATLKEMVIAYETVVVQPGQTVPMTDLPAFKENERIISGPASIKAYLKELENFMADWQLFQSDSCYIRDKSNC
jgi:hypothetical protein